MRPLHRHPYTFIEMLVVCGIVVLVSALVVPRIRTTSKRLTVENALSKLRAAFTETATRARAGGKALALVLLEDEKRFEVREYTNELDRSWHPPRAARQEEDGEEEEAPRRGVLSGESSYEVPADVEWTELPSVEGDEDGIVFAFFPDGEAAGPPLEFTVADRHFRLVVDSVLGRVTILDLD